MGTTGLEDAEDSTSVESTTVGSLLVIASFSGFVLYAKSRKRKSESLLSEWETLKLPKFNEDEAYDREVDELLEFEVAKYSKSKKAKHSKLKTAKLSKSKEAELFEPDENKPLRRKQKKILKY